MYAIVKSSSLVSYLLGPGVKDESKKGNVSTPLIKVRQARYKASRLSAPAVLSMFTRRPGAYSHPYQAEQIIPPALTGSCLALQDSIPSPGHRQSHRAFLKTL